MDNSRCLVQNKTGSVACVQSCFGENGGCEKDQVCINAVRECNGAHYPYQCSSQVKCLSLSGMSHYSAVYQCTVYFKVTFFNGY